MIAQSLDALEQAIKLLQTRVEEIRRAHAPTETCDCGYENKINGQCSCGYVHDGPVSAREKESEGPTVTTNGQQTSGTGIEWDAEHGEVEQLLRYAQRVVDLEAELLEKDAEIARLRDAAAGHRDVAAVYAADAIAPTCQHCGLPLTCSSERAELIHGLQQMYAETLTRAEQAEAALAAREREA